MKVKPQKIIDFDYKASFYLNQNPCSAYLFYGEKTGKITVFDFEFNQTGTFSIDSKMNINIPCSVHPEKELFSVIHEKQALYIFDFQGNRVKNFAGNYACAAFNANGDLWAFERISHEQLKWTIYDANWEIVVTLDMEDPMYDSSLFLTSIPGSNDMILDIDSFEAFNWIISGNYPEKQKELFESIA